MVTSIDSQNVILLVIEAALSIRRYAINPLILLSIIIFDLGVLYDKELLPQCLGNRSLNFDFQKFRYMCIMAGCDYHDSLPGIGLGKSFKFWGKVSQPSLESALPKIPGYLNMNNKVKVTDEYIRGFIQGIVPFIQKYLEHQKCDIELSFEALKK